MAWHSGPFRCQCGQIHADKFEGPSNDLLPYIDLNGVTALNAVGDGKQAARRVFKAYDERLSRDQFLESEEDDPSLIIRVPFTCPVKIRSFTIIGGGEGLAPRSAKFFINRETLDFGDAEESQPVQQWDLAVDGDPNGLIEYPTQFSKFQNVSSLWIFIPDSHGADHTLVSYIGLSGVGTEHKREAVQAVYELRGVGSLNDPMKEATGGQMGL